MFLMPLLNICLANSCALSFGVVSFLCFLPIIDLRLCSLRYSKRYEVAIKVLNINAACETYENPESIPFHAHYFWEVEVA